MKTKKLLCSLLLIAVLLGLSGWMYDSTIRQGNTFITGLLTVLGNVTQTAGQNQYKAFSVNSVLWVDGVKYTTLAGCYADLPSTGGTCRVPPNYTETMSASLTMSKNNAGFIFEGPATINMGSNQIVVATNTMGAFITGQSVVGGSSFGAGGTTAGLKFVYTGNATSIPVGGSANPVGALKLENFYVDLTGAGNSAAGIDLINVHGGFTVKNVFFNGKGGASTQVGLSLNDAGGCAGACGTWDGIIEGNWFSNLFTGIACNGNIQELAFINNIMFAGATSSTGFSINCAGGGNGSYIWGSTVSAYTTGYSFTANATGGWEVHANGNSNTVDIFLTSGSSNNNVYWDNSQTGPIISDGSGATSNNHVYVAGYNGLLNEQPAASAIVGTGADATYYTYTLPARALPPGKCLDIETWANHSTGTASTVYKVFFGSTAFINNTSTGSGQVYFRLHVCNNNGSITAQHGGQFVVVPNSTIATLTFAGGTSAENTANAVVIKATFNVAATDQLTPEDFVVRMSN